MKKKNIRKYILEALAVLLVIGACITVNELSRKEAYAGGTEVGSINLEAKDQTGTGASLHEIGINSVIIKNKGSDATKDGSYSNGKIETNEALEDGYYTINLDGFKVGTYDATVESGSTTKDFSVNSGIVTEADFESVSLKYIDTNKYILISATPSQSDINIDHKDSEDALTSELLSKINGASITYSNDGTDKSTIKSGDVSITKWVTYDGSKDYNKNDYGKQIIQYIGSVNLPSGVEDLNNTVLSKNPIVTVTVPETKATLTWSVTIDNANITENGKPSSKVVDTITYQILNGSTVVGKYTENAKKNQSILLKNTSGISVPRNGSYTLKLISCTVTGSSTSVDLSSGSYETSPVSFVSQSAVISDSISTIDVAASVMPSDYSKVKEGGLSSDDDHKKAGITEVNLKSSKVKDILDYIYTKYPDKYKEGLDNIIKEGTKDLSLVLVVETKDSLDHKDALQDKAEDYGDDSKDAKLTNYFDITLRITKGESIVKDLPAITDLGDNSISLTYKIPSSVTSSSSSSNGGKKYYNLMRYHDKAKGVLDEYTSDTTIEFKLNEFSEFATAYYTKKSSSSSSNAGSGSSSAFVPGGQGDDAGAGGTDKSKTPKTGDDFNPRIWIYLLIVCATVASAAWILLQDTKDEKKDKG